MAKARLSNGAKELLVDSTLEKGVTLRALRTAAESCTACDLYRNATQVVFGEGAPRAPVMLVGEQPGDQEDQIGRPFVGPAGKLLRKLLEQAGFSESDIYVTNAVKHFKWERQGERRIHKKPLYSEVMACKPWLSAELSLVGPTVVVCLGATAAQAFMGTSFRLTQHRGQFFQMEGAPYWIATLHPSAILRMPAYEDRERARGELLSDLRSVRAVLDEGRLRGEAVSGVKT